MRKSVVALAVLLFCVQSLQAQHTQTAVFQSETRLQLAGEKAVLQFDLSPEVKQTKAEYAAAKKRWDDIRGEVQLSLDADAAYTSLRDEAKDVRGYMLTAKLKDDQRVILASKWVDLTTAMANMQHDRLMGEAFKQDRERYEKATDAMNELEKRKRLAVLSNYEWQYAWERLSSDKVNYSETQYYDRCFHHYYTCYYRCYR